MFFNSLSRNIKLASCLWVRSLGMNTGLGSSPSIVRLTLLTLEGRHKLYQAFPSWGALRLEVRTTMSPML